MVDEEDGESAATFEDGMEAAGIAVLDSSDTVRACVPGAAKPPALCGGVGKTGIPFAPLWVGDPTDTESVRAAAFDAPGTAEAPGASPEEGDDVGAIGESDTVMGDSSALVAEGPRLNSKSFVHAGEAVPGAMVTAGAASAVDSSCSDGREEHAAGATRAD